MRSNQELDTFNMNMKFYKKFIRESKDNVTRIEYMNKGLGVISFAYDIELITAEEMEKYDDEIIELAMTSFSKQIPAE